VTEAQLDELSRGECLDLLRASEVGRIALATDSRLVVLPVNYRLVETRDKPYIALRTRPGNVLDRTDVAVAFEIDGVDAARHEGWSVLVHGALNRVYPEVPWIRELFDSHPWLGRDRDQWLVIEPIKITGRRLRGETREWALDLPRL